MDRAATTSDTHSDEARVDIGSHWGGFVALSVARLVFLAVDPTSQDIAAGVFGIVLKARPGALA